MNGPEDQTIKYWDYSASEYHFVAGSPIKNFVYDVTLGTGEINAAKVTGLAGHIDANPTEGTGTQLVADPVYIADPVKLKKANNEYKKTVTFNFQRQQSMVRVGFYETIPGYFVSNVKFYEADATTPAGNNIILYSSEDGYFVGGTNVSGTVKYDWTASKPSYTFTYDDTNDDTNLKKSKNWYAGNLGTGYLAETSTTTVAHLYGSDKDMATATGYFTVLPTPASTIASPILIKCDYTLNAPESGEVINVTGATVAIPAAFSKWEANTRYTYLFKISDNTNGTTGTPGTTDPAGLFPITFAAVVKDVEQGTTTTVATPSITTYQEGSVEGTKIEYKTGKPIYATVADETTGTLKDLNTDGTVGNVQVYKLNKERTEADLQIKAIANTEFNATNKIDTEVPTTAFGKIEANKYLKFTPVSEGYYAIQYLTKEATTTDPITPAAYTYKVVYVKAAPTVAP